MVDPLSQPAAGSPDEGRRILDALVLDRGPWIPNLSGVAGTPFLERSRMSAHEVARIEVLYGERLPDLEEPASFIAYVLGNRQALSDIGCSFLPSADGMDFPGLVHTLRSLRTKNDAARWIELVEGTIDPRRRIYLRCMSAFLFESAARASEISFFLLDPPSTPEMIIQTATASVIVDRLPGAPTVLHQMSWFERRRKFWSRFDAMWEVSSERSPYLIFAGDEDRFDISSRENWRLFLDELTSEDLMKDCLPHRTPTARSAMRSNLLGVAPWSWVTEVCPIL